MQKVLNFQETPVLMAFLLIINFIMQPVQCMDVQTETLTKKLEDSNKKLEEQLSERSYASDLKAQVEKTIKEYNKKIIELTRNILDGKREKAKATRKRISFLKYYLNALKNQLRIKNVELQELFEAGKESYDKLLSEPHVPDDLTKPDPTTEAIDKREKLKVKVDEYIKLKARLDSFTSKIADKKTGKDKSKDKQKVSNEKSKGKKPIIYKSPTMGKAEAEKLLKSMINKMEQVDPDSTYDETDVWLESHEILENSHKSYFESDLKEPKGYWAEMWSEFPAIPALDSAPNTSSLIPAVKSKKVSISVSGDGTTTSSVLCSLSNETEEDQRIRFVPGDLLVPGDSGYQTMMVTKEKLVDIPAGKTIETPVETFCVSPKTVNPPPPKEKGVEYQPDYPKNLQEHLGFLAILATSLEMASSDAYSALMIPEKNRTHTIGQLTVWKEVGEKTNDPDDNITHKTIRDDIMKKSGKIFEELPSEQQKGVDQGVAAIFNAVDLTQKRSRSQPEDNVTL